MERKRMPMADWYDPRLLVRTAVRVAVSTAFGEMADRREAMAAANAVASQPFDPSFDYSAAGGDGSFWFDYLADTGDGWDPTFAMAQLLTQDTIAPKDAEEPLERGQILFLGGDLVYPTASREEYEHRFLHPFEAAHDQARGRSRKGMPDVYAIPGNHDWYDGLSAFSGLFCRRRIAAPGSVGISRPGRKIAGRATKQTRSYFAVKLPGGWWLWGTDSQLKGYIDQPQIDFFQFVASEWMEDGSKLILCVGMPNWAYVDPAEPAKEFETFSYLERLAGLARRPLTAAEKASGETGESRSKGHRLRLVLAGDSHHYSRYVEPAPAGVDPVHYVTCGGGGAFLHPTHQLEDKKFDWDYPPPGLPPQRKEGAYERRFEIADRNGFGGKALFPDAETSRALASGNWRFAWDNFRMTAVFGAAYLLFNWLLNMNARVEGYPSLVHALTVADFWQAPLRYVWAAFVSPWPSILFIAAMGAYFYFADSPNDRAQRLKLGVTHGLVQAGAATVVTSLFLWIAGAAAFGGEPIRGVGPTLAVGAILLLASALAALVSATVFGLYLWLNLNRWGRHWNEAFSALAIADYKSFLRMRIDAEGTLHLHPVGLERVPDGGGTPESLRPHLIEQPIRIAGPTAPAG